MSADVSVCAVSTLLLSLRVDGCLLHIRAKVSHRLGFPSWRVLWPHTGCCGRPERLCGTVGLTVGWATGLAPMGGTQTPSRPRPRVSLVLRRVGPSTLLLACCGDGWRSRTVFRDTSHSGWLGSPPGHGDTYAAPVKHGKPGVCGDVGRILGLSRRPETGWATLDTPPRVHGSCTGQAGRGGFGFGLCPQSQWELGSEWRDGGRTR